MKDLDVLDQDTDSVLQGLKDRDSQQIKRKSVTFIPHCDCGVGKKKVKKTFKMQPTTSKDGETCDFCEHYFVLLAKEGDV